MKKLITAALAAALAAFTPMTLVPAPAAGADAVPVVIASYNIRTAGYGQANSWNQAWGDFHAGWDANDAARMARVAATIRDRAARGLTIAALQEAHPRERREVLANLPTHWAGTAPYQNGETVVLWDTRTWKQLGTGYFWIQVKADGTKRPQVRTLLQHRVTGKRLYVLSVHFPTASRPDYLKRDAARRTVEAIRGTAVAQRVPFVLAGDINAPASGIAGDVFRASGVMKYARVAAARRYNDDCRSYIGRAGEGGFAGSAGRQPYGCTHATTGHATQIDHLWTSRGIGVNTHRVIGDARTSRSSDHNPILARLSR